MICIPFRHFLIYTSSVFLSLKLTLFLSLKWTVSPKILSTLPNKPPSQPTTTSESTSSLTGGGRRHKILLQRLIQMGLGRRGILYTATPVSPYVGPLKLINNIFNSDLVFNLRRESESVQNNENGEVGISGRDYALVPDEMWLEALKWHSDSKTATKDGRSFSAAEEDMADVYPLQLRLSVLRETNSLGVKISKKDNAVVRFRRACKIFSIELLCIWDFSGQTTLFLSKNNNKFAKENQRQSELEILLELQVYSSSDFIRSRDVKKDDMICPFPNGTSVMMNGGTANLKTSSFWGQFNSLLWRIW